LKRFFLLSIISVLLLETCTTIDIYEKNTVLPKHRWPASFKPEFTFTIEDTSVPYQVYLVVRHNEKYNYNNLWVNIYSQMPGDSARKNVYELPLATNEKGWLATGMDDIYEHRIPLTSPLDNLIFKKQGNYKFIVEQIMREDPLENVLSVGLRVEKKQ